MLQLLYLFIRIDIETAVLTYKAFFALDSGLSVLYATITSTFYICL